MEAAEGLYAHLQEGKPARTLPASEALGRFLKETPLLTAKPVIYVANVAEEDLPDGRGNPQVEAVRRKALEEGAEVVVVSARLEAELAELSGEEARELLAAYGLQESGLQRLARAGYRALDLLTFFTAGAGTVTLPSAFWYISRIGTISRGLAATVLLRLWQNTGFFVCRSR